MLRWPGDGGQRVSHRRGRDAQRDRDDLPLTDERDLRDRLPLPPQGNPFAALQPCPRPVLWLTSGCTKPLQSVSDFGYALCDITTELSILVTRTELPDAVTAYLLDKLSNVEYRLSNGTSEKLQMGALVGAFTVARTMLTPVKIKK